MSTRLPLDVLLSEYRPGSYDPPWTWDDECRDLARRDGAYLRVLTADVASNGIHEPVQVHHGEARVWDGHHRIVAAITLGLTDVPVADARYSDSGRSVENH